MGAANSILLDPSNNITNKVHSTNGVMIGTNKTVNIYSNDRASETPIIQKKRKLKNIEEANPDKKEVNNLFDEIQQQDDEDADNASPVYLRLQKQINVSNATHKWIVKDLNVTHRFQDYQSQCIDHANDHGFILETNVHEILALSSIFLLKPKQNSNRLLEHFTSADTDQILHNVLDKVCGQSHEDIEFDNILTVKIMKIIKDMLKSSGNRETAERHLQELKYDDAYSQNIYQVKIIQIMLNLYPYAHQLLEHFRTQKLPSTEIASPKGEIELIVGYLDPVLSIMFNNHDKNVKLVWPNLVQNESIGNNHDVNTGRRPDAVIRAIHERYFGEALGFGEAKTSERLNDNYELTRDLVRCAIFAKESIDINDVQGTLSFQAVGSRVVFYVTTLIKEGIYVHAEVCALIFPNSLIDMKDFCNEFDDILKLLIIFDNYCEKNAAPINLTDKRSTLNSPSFRSYVDKSKSKYNKCHIKF